MEKLDYQGALDLPATNHGVLESGSIEVTVSCLVQICHAIFQIIS